MIIWRNFFKASPQPSPWEREHRYYCLLISYKTNLAPSPTERVGERLPLLKVESESYLEAEFRQVAVVEAPFVVYRRFDSNRT